MADIRIEVAYATVASQVLLSLDVPEGSTVREAVELSRIAGRAEFPHSAVGVFGKVVDAERFVLREGDRVELYRPLLVDPKEVRRRRAEKTAKTIRRKS